MKNHGQTQNENNTKKTNVLSWDLNSEMNVMLWRARVSEFQILGASTLKDLPLIVERRYLGSERGPSPEDLSKQVEL